MVSTNCLLSVPWIKILWFVGLREDRALTWSTRHWDDQTFVLPDSLTLHMQQDSQRKVGNEQ